MVGLKMIGDGSTMSQWMFRRCGHTRFQHSQLGDSEGIDEGIVVGMTECWPEDEGR